MGCTSLVEVTLAQMCKQCRHDFRRALRTVDLQAEEWYGSRHRHVSSWQLPGNRKRCTLRSATIAFGSSTIVHFFQKYRNQARARQALPRLERAIP